MRPSAGSGEAGASVVKPSFDVLRQDAWNRHSEALRSHARDSAPPPILEQYPPADGARSDTGQAPHATPTGMMSRAVASSSSLVP
jgi:hypothetical protein